MPFTKEQRNQIYERTDGYCHICHRKLARTNYGQLGRKGAWEVEHSRPRSLGGTHHGNNLYAACIPCNRDKSNYHTRTARAWNGKSRAPISRSKRKQAVEENTVLGGVAGALVGAALGPVGLVVGAGIGAFVGKSMKPER